MKERKHIGTRERIDFVDYNLNEITVKIDTGAYYGSIHCSDVEVAERNNKQYLSFSLLDEQHPGYNKTRISTSEFKQVTIQSSFGEVQRRYLVKMKVSILDKEYITYFSLANRSKMVVPVLLGRYFLKNKFLVDVDRPPFKQEEKKQ